MIISNLLTTHSIGSVAVLLVMVGIVLVAHIILLL